MSLRTSLNPWVAIAILAVVISGLLFVACEMVPQGQNMSAGQNAGTEVQKTEQAKPETPKAEKSEKAEPKEEGKKEQQEVSKEKPAPGGVAVIGKWPWIIPNNTYDFYDYGKIIVSAYEYPCWEKCGKLQNLKVVPGHNNQTVKPTGEDINLGYNVCSRRYIHSGPAINRREIHCPQNDPKVYTTSFDKMHFTNPFEWRQESEKPAMPKERYVGHKGDTIIECDSFYVCDTTIFCDTLHVAIAEFPVEREMLLVVTLDHNIPVKGAKVRWTFMDPKGARYSYGRERAVSMDILKGAGVPENAAQLSRDQIITEFGHGPVYAQLPQTVDHLGPKSGAPVDKIEIAPNQSWVLVRGFEPGISKVFVTIVHPKNYTFPGMEYAVRWIDPIPPLHPDFDLRVNITENQPEQKDPFVYNDQIDKKIDWKITVVDETDYYLNPKDDGIVPIHYAVNYDLRFRRDPIQWDSAKNWKDCYALFLDPAGVPDPAIFHMNRLIYECKHQKAIPPAEPVITNYTRYVTESGNTFTHSAHSIFKVHQSPFHYNGGVNKHWGEVNYWRAQQKAVDVSLRYVECDTFRCMSRWNHISDESITLEFNPGDDIGIAGLEVQYMGTKGTVQEVQLTNHGSAPVYEVFLEKPNGKKRAIAHMIPGADAEGNANVITIYEGYGMTAKDNVLIERGDWIWYYVYSTGNTERPVVAQQKRVRVQ